MNNEYSAGCLAVLVESQAPSSSPQSPGSVYTCDACPEGRPQRYYLFPRSELNTLQGAPYNPVRDLRVFENHLELATREVEPAAQFLYQLSKSLDVESVSMTDGYGELHRRLSAEHRIEHPLEECPTLKRSYTVRIWDGTNGWTEKLVPWTGGQQR